MTNTPHEAGERFIAAARQSLAEEFDEPTLETVQAVIAIVQHDFFRSKGKKSMIYVSLALRMAATLELHIEPEDPKMSFQEREERRRTYWSLVVLDRLAHSGPHWQVHLRTDTIHIQLPCRDYYYENNIPVVTETLQGTAPAPIPSSSSAPTTRKSELGLHSYIVKAIILWCEINKYVMEEFKNETIPPWKEGSRYHHLETRLQELFASLPPSYHYSRERLMALDTINAGTALVQLHAELVLSLCSLSRSMYPFNYRKLKFSEPPPKAFIERAAINIITSANAQSAIIDDILDMEDFHLAPFIGFGVFALSSVHIANSFSPDQAVAAQAKNNLAINLKFLVIMREYWYSVGVWCVILKDRYFEKAKRHKLKTQNASYKKQSAGSVGIIESIPGNNKQSNNEATSSADQVFSRPGTPPLAYAPEDFIKVVMNQPQNQTSEHSSGMATPNGTRTPVSGSRSPTRQVETSVKDEPPKDEAARTWEKAVSSSYSDSTAYHGDNGENEPLAKKSKLDQYAFSPQSSTPGYMNAASPSQFADIFAPSAYRKESTDANDSSTIQQDTFKAESPENGAPEHSPSSTSTGTNSTINGFTINMKSKNNLLQDTSGEWLNSLELADFAQFAGMPTSWDYDNGTSGTSKSVMDFNHPAYWFDAEVKANDQTIAESTTPTAASITISKEPAADLMETGVRRTAVFSKNPEEAGHKKEDTSLFQQAIFHQPFAPDLNSLGPEADARPFAESPVAAPVEKPKPQQQGYISNLDEMFQQVDVNSMDRRQK